MLRPEQIRMAKFALVGVLNTGVDFAVFMLLVYTFGVPSAGAQVASFSCGIANSYWWNRKWTFRAAGKVNGRELLRFVAVNGLSLACATAVLLGLQHGLGWSPAAAKAVSILASLAVNYAGSRFWVFRMETGENRAG
ncbi:GtrA family protein [Cohnella pontilimi]|uniref:GtrA family protein n=1 Tax=Cohnella pontilimi TaxID=2564100 RepID=A0A4U0F5C2_9BACL|nr:GtrA family protein [Cohnella pontilimi]TJY39783.1 GtrA family protein [Cohnella pontilimi]